MNVLKNWRKKLLFGFYMYPSEEWPEMEDAGFSVRLFANGTVIYQTYMLNIKRDPTILLSRRVKLSGDTVSRITRTLAGYAREIDALPEFTNNGSFDGSFYDFVFCGKYISSLNIRRTDMLDAISFYPDYYEKYRFDMADENTILDIFTRINQAMRQDNVQLYLDHLRVGDRIIY